MHQKKNIMETVVEDDIYPGRKNLSRKILILCRFSSHRFYMKFFFFFWVVSGKHRSFFFLSFLQLILVVDMIMINNFFFIRLSLFLLCWFQMEWHVQIIYTKSMMMMMMMIFFAVFVWHRMEMPFTNYCCCCCCCCYPLCVFINFCLFCWAFDSVSVFILNHSFIWWWNG